MFYIGTVVFNRSDRDFWKMTPRTFRALCDAHIETQSPDGRSERNAKRPVAYIDQILL